MTDRVLWVLFAFNLAAVTLLAWWAFLDTDQTARTALRFVALWALTVGGPLVLAWKTRSLRALGMGIAALAIALALLE